MWLDGDDNIDKKKDELNTGKNENQTNTELSKLFVNLANMLAREIEIRDQILEERRLESEQNMYMNQIFMCDFVFSNL